MAARTLPADRHQAFAAEYLRNGRNASDAYRVTYNKPTHTARQCTSEGYRVLNLKPVQTIIQEADAKAREALGRVTDRYAITRERIADELARIAFANMADYLRALSADEPIEELCKLDRDVAAAMGQVSVKHFDDGLRVTFKLADKRAALVDLARLKGYIIERKDVRIINSVDDLNDEELAALAASGEDAASERRH